jgi:hypothetical protein
VPHDRLSQRPDPDRDHHQVGRPAELGIDLLQQRVVALHDPARDLLVAVPGGVLDTSPAGLLVGELGGPTNRGVVVAVHPHHLRALLSDAGGGLPEHHLRHEHARPDTEVSRHAGDCAAVVAVGRGHQRDTRVPVEHLAARPGGTQHLERREPQPRRLVLYQHAADPELGRELGDGNQRRGGISRQRPVERVSVTRHGRARPVPSGRRAVPRHHADHHPRGN